MDHGSEQRIDLNTARRRELQSLPGVDPILARRIVMDRKLYGVFYRLEDLTRVEGVSPRLLANIAQQIRIRIPEADAPVGRVTFSPSGENVDLLEPVIFWGTPESMEAILVLRNEGEAMVSGVILEVENSEIRDADGLPLTRLKLPYPIWPGEQRRIPAKVQIDASTAPGEYPADLVSGTERLNATFYVSERLLLRATPSHITLRNSPGAANQRKVVIHNYGNVAVTIGDIGGIVIEEAGLECRVVRETVRHTKHPSWDQLVGTASDELKKQFSHEMLRIRTTNKPVRVAPGETAVLDLEVQIPKRLRRNRYYVGTARLYNTAIVFGLQPELGEEEPVE
jgi:hypothetical protein